MYHSRPIAVSKWKIRIWNKILVYSEVLSGYQPDRVVVQWTNQRFEDHLCPHPQGCDVAGQVITDSQSVCPSWPRAPSCDSWSYFSLEENFGIVFRGASTLTGGWGCHIQGSQSFSVLCVHTRVWIYTTTNIIMYKGVYIHAMPVSPGIA
jgi:hypothetical protein